MNRKLILKSLRFVSFRTNLALFEGAFDIAASKYHHRPFYVTEAESEVPYRL